VASSIQNDDVRKIASELAACIRKAGVARGRASEGLMRTGTGAGRDADGPIEHDLAAMRANYDIASAAFTSHRPRVGRFIIAMKNIVREFLVQLLARQSMYNAAATRAITSLKRRLDQVADEQARIAQRLAALESRLDIRRTSEIRPQTEAPTQAPTDKEFVPHALDNRLDALEQAIGERKRGGGST
jgi:hypothetical protein